MYVHVLCTCKWKLTKQLYSFYIIYILGMHKIFYRSLLVLLAQSEAYVKIITTWMQQWTVLKGRLI
jgi:hypothetical protein